jgi:hypothetical protein
VVFATSDTDLLQAIDERLRSRGIAFGDVRLERGRLDDVFRALTREEPTR